MLFLKEEPNVAEKDLVGRKAEVKVYLKGVDKEEKEKEINIQNKFSMISLKGHSKFIRDLITITTSATAIGQGWILCFFHNVVCINRL